jgi:hypothetical protein
MGGDNALAGSRPKGAYQRSLRLRMESNLRLVDQKK